MILKAPRAKKRPHTSTIHGITRVDDYHWLKADNWQEVMQTPSALPQDIRDYLEAENAYHEVQMADTEALQKTLFSELKGRIKEDDSSVPAPDGKYIYYSSTVTGGQYARYCRRLRDGGAEEIMFDGDALAKGHDYFSFGGIALSPDQTLAAWSYDNKGSEFYDIRIRDLNSGLEHEDLLLNTAGGAVWAADGKSIFYTTQDESHRPLKTYRHVLGTPQAEDVLVHDEKDTGLFTGVGQTSSEKFITVDIHDHDTSEIWLIDADAPEVAPRLMISRDEKIEAEIEHWNDRFLIKTNKDGAEDYKIVTAAVANPGSRNWVDLIAHRPGIFCFICSV
jgi:oligopeptidase B